MPNRVYGRLAHVDLDALIDTRKRWKIGCLEHDLAIDLQLPFAIELVELRDLEVGHGHGDGRADVETFRVFLCAAKGGWREEAKREMGTRTGDPGTAMPTFFHISCAIAPHGSKLAMFAHEACGPTLYGGSVSV
jgi:hypothetical protein